MSGMLIMLALSAIGGLVGVLTWVWQLPWLPLAASVAILVGSVKVYFFLLDRAARYAWEHIEEISGNLGA